MTFHQWWNSKPRSDFEEEIYCRLQETWEQAVKETEKKCCEIAAKHKIYGTHQQRILIEKIIEEIEESD